MAIFNVINLKLSKNNFWTFFDNFNNDHSLIVRPIIVQKRASSELHLLFKRTKCLRCLLYGDEIGLKGVFFGLRLKDILIFDRITWILFFFFRWSTVCRCLQNSRTPRNLCGFSDYQYCWPHNNYQNWACQFEILNKFWSRWHVDSN